MSRSWNQQRESRQFSSKMLFVFKLKSSRAQLDISRVPHQYERFFVSFFLPRSSCSGKLMVLHTPSKQHKLAAIAAANTCRNETSTPVSAASVISHSFTSSKLILETKLVIVFSHARNRRINRVLVILFLLSLLFVL